MNFALHYFKKITVQLILVLSFSFTFFAQDKSDSLRCFCFSSDTTNLKKLQNVYSELHELSPSFLSTSLSLMEIMDIVLLEKYYFFQKTSKHLKYTVTKNIYDLQNKKISREDSVKLAKNLAVNNFLQSNIKIFSSKLNNCLETEKGKRFVQKKNLILQINPNYFIEKISYDNSTYDLANKKFTSLILLEENLLKELHRRMRIMDLEDSIKSKKNKNYILMKEVFEDARIQLEKYTNEKMNLVYATEENFFPAIQNDPLLYIVKKVMVYKDTSVFSIVKGNEEQVIIMNNTMYLFQNDSLIKKIDEISNANSNEIFNAKKPLPIEEISGTYFTLQIGTFSREKMMQDLKVCTNVFYKKLENDMYRYSFGIYKSMDDVEKAKKLLFQIGYQDVIVIAYKDGEKITIDEAKSILN